MQDFLFLVYSYNHRKRTFHPMTQALLEMGIDSINHNEGIDWMRIKYLGFLLFFLVSCNISATISNLLTTGTPETLVSPLVPSDTPGSQPATSYQVTNSAILIDGVSYQAYEIPGNPFRFVCQEPCKVDPILISAQYTGFRIQRDRLIQLTGIDTLPELQPVDIHIENDSKCGALKDSPALSFAWYDPKGNAYICTFLFEYAVGFNGQPYTADVAVRQDQQTILIHEYLHTLFFGRLASEAGSQHDFVTPLALYVTNNWNGDSELCAYHPQTPPGDYGGYLIQQLCQRNGFTLGYLAESLRQLDQLVQSGNGQLQEGFLHPVASMAQYRQILNSLLGSNSTASFREACWPAKLFGDSDDLPASCLFRTPTVEPTRLP
ncbi:MAG: hypothetical protein WCF08_00170 [Anaerolineaceae bacterium]